MDKQEIDNFLKECYIGNLEEIKYITQKYNILINMLELLFYIINGKANIERKKDILLYLNEINVLDLNVDNGFALEIAVQYNDIDLVQFFINEGVKMSSHEDGILLFYSAQSNNYSMFSLLRKLGIKMDLELLNEIKNLELSDELKIEIDNYV